MAANEQKLADDAQNERVDFKSAAWNSQQGAWQITSDLWESPLAIRQKGSTYLRQFAKEPGEKFANRLANSVLINEFRHTIDSMAGIVFRKDPKPTQAPEAISELFTDIDECGNSLHSFVLDAFAKFLRDGNGYIYVDSDPFTPMDESRRPTLGERLDDRPRWIFYEASQAINHQFENVNSRAKLVRITFAETILEPRGTFGEQEVTLYRTLTPGHFAVYRKDKDHEAPTLVVEGDTGLDFIPVVPLAEIGSVPPFLVLAMLNLLHYNKTSDFDELCTLICVPERIYIYDTDADAANAAEKQTTFVSAGIARIMWGQNAKAMFNEVSGAAAEIARTRYQDIEEQMAKLGVGFLTPTILPRTATEVADNAGQRESRLSKFAREFENAVEKALYITGQYLNAIRGKNTVDLNSLEDVALKLNIDYNRLTFSEAQLAQFSEFVDTGKLSLETFLEWLPQVADLPDTFDPKDEMRRLRDFNAPIGDEEPPEPEDNSDEEQ